MCIYKWTRIPCALGLIGAGSLHSDSIYNECCFAWEHILKHSPSLSSLFPLLIQCDGCLSASTTWGRMAQGLPNSESFWMAQVY